MQGCNKNEDINDSTLNIATLGVTCSSLCMET